MRARSFCFFLLCLLVAAGFCYADDGSFRVVGSADCADCAKNSFQIGRAFSGLRVTIDCKMKNGVMKRVGSGKLDGQGRFEILVPGEIVDVKGEKLKQECYAQLQNAVDVPCPAHDGREASKIVFKSQQRAFAPTKNLRFSVALCSSKFFWPFFNPNHPWFRIPPQDPGYTSPPIYTPPVETPPSVNQPPVVEPLPPPVETPPVVTTPEPPTVNPPCSSHSPVCNQPPVEPLPPPVNTPPVVMPQPPPVETPPVATPEPPSVNPPCTPHSPVCNQPPVQPLPPPVPVHEPKPPCPPKASSTRS